MAGEPIPLQADDLICLDVTHAKYLGAGGGLFRTAAPIDHGMPGCQPAVGLGADPAGGSTGCQSSRRRPSGSSIQAKWP